jgi:hypothetical protein
MTTNQVMPRNGGNVLDFIYHAYDLTRPYHNLGSFTMACHHKALGSIPDGFT